MSSRGGSPGHVTSSPLSIVGPRRKIVSAASLIGAALLLLCSGNPWAAYAAEVTNGSDTRVPDLLGMASGEDWRDDLELLRAATGRYPAIYQMFRAIDGGTAPDPNWSSTSPYGIRRRTQAWFEDIHARGMVPYLEVHVTSSTAFGDLLSGRLDGQLRAFGTMIKEWLDRGGGRRILLAPFPEANNKAHPWGGDPDRFRRAYSMVYDAVVSTGVSRSEVRLVFGVNGLANLDYDHERNDYESFYPGDGIVDIVGFAKINRDAPEWRSFEEYFRPHIQELRETVSPSKPILITQTASVATGRGGEIRSEWLEEITSAVVSDPQLIGAIYFNRVKSELGSTYDYRVVMGSGVDPAFAREAQRFSSPDEIAWIFDGRMDKWVALRESKSGSAAFLDVANSPYHIDIEWLARAGVTRGCNPPVNDRFCPEDPVSRGQMAAFLVRAFDLEAGGAAEFVDTQGSVFARDIAALAAAGVTRGCNPPVNDRFCPEDPVSRGQMAAFLRRSFELEPAGSLDR